MEADRAMQTGLDEVRELIASALRRSTLGPLLPEIATLVASGKMLRSRMALRLGPAAGASHPTVLHAAAAIEMIHGASLLHDDVIDGASLRRGNATFWVESGTSGAILLGDLLYCRGIALSGQVEEGRLMGILVDRAAEMCDAESEQELLLRGAAPSWEKCVSIARRKTGALFAFVGRAVGGRDPALADALEAAAYDIGTAYQIADDLLDASGNEALSGKTLGTDRARHKLTAATCVVEGAPEPRGFIRSLCDGASARLQPWPAARTAWDALVAEEFAPSIDAFTART
jgi:octaprenyl-diphosphate synthase